jgi:hypothetical protein
VIKAPAIPVGADLAAAAKALDAEVRRVAEKGLARTDGYVYGMDVATLLLYAARRGDAELYASLRAAAEKLVLQDPDDPYTGGFVLWRTKAGAKPAQSGAAEALVMAQALWTGAEAFDRKADRELAETIMDGYAKHAYVLQGTWVARRSFDFKTRTFASLSVLSDYRPDFVAEAERAKGRSEWRGFAERSYKLLEKTAAPSGLLYPVIQPEIGATYPGAGLDAYAPNGITPLEDACHGAAGAVAGLPQLGRGVLDFVAPRARAGKLRAFYSTDDGTTAGDAPPLGASGNACLVSLAVALGNADALATLDPRLAADMQALAKSRAQLPTAGALLLAAQARGAF